MIETLLLALAIFPVCQGSACQVEVQANDELDANGVPLHPPTRSIALLDEGANVVACIAITSLDPVQVAYSLPPGQRTALVGRAYGDPGCTGIESEPSAETAYHYPGMVPRNPKLR